MPGEVRGLAPGHLNLNVLSASLVRTHHSAAIEYSPLVLVVVV
jgi:hypothetical protein